MRNEMSLFKFLKCGFPLSEKCISHLRFLNNYFLVLNPCEEKTCKGAKDYARFYFFNTGCRFCSDSFLRSADRRSWGKPVQPARKKCDKYDPANQVDP